MLLFHCISLECFCWMYFGLWNSLVSFLFAICLGDVTWVCCLGLSSFYKNFSSQCNCQTCSQLSECFLACPCFAKLNNLESNPCAITEWICPLLTEPLCYFSTVFPLNVFVECTLGCYLNCQACTAFWLVMLNCSLKPLQVLVTEWSSGLLIQALLNFSTTFHLKVFYKSTLCC